MKKLTRTLTLIAIATAVSFAGVPTAAAIEDTALSLEILVNGMPLNEIAARGTTYIEAVKHAEYSIRLRNNTASRLAVALAVDGLNTIDAKTTDPKTASKWVLDPWRTVTIDGWQIGPDTARKFFFTSEDKSYGAWLGKTSNLGVIEAVAYREFVPPPPAEPMLRQDRDSSSRRPSAESAAPRSAGKAAPARPSTTSPPPVSAARSTTRSPGFRCGSNATPPPSSGSGTSTGSSSSASASCHHPRRSRRWPGASAPSGFDDFEFAPDPWGGK